MAKKIVVGLGNPGKEYEKTRHNTGWIVASLLDKEAEWKESSGTDTLYTHIDLGKNKLEILKPTTFMNKSGKAVAYAVNKHKVKLENLVVIHDDIDIPLSKMKISFGRGDGGHNGVASVIKAIKSKEFVRIRIGVSPTTPSGKLKKPKGEKKVYNYLLGEFKPKELQTIKKVAKKATEAIEMIYAEGLPKAMSLYN